MRKFDRDLQAAGDAMEDDFNQDGWRSHRTGAAIFLNP